MREIKFRYKVKDSDNLIYDESDDFGYLQKKRKIFSISKGGVEFVISEMQYTGLKDKNGVEIYEGDYVLGTHTNRYGKTYPMNYEVVYSEDRFWLKCIDDVENIYPKSLRTIVNEIEVKGNIYENPLK